METNKCVSHSYVEFCPETFCLYWHIIILFLLVKENIANTMLGNNIFLTRRNFVPGGHTEDDNILFQTVIYM